MIDPGTAHKFWNAGDETLRFRAEVRPHSKFESLIETMSPRSRRQDERKGMPGPLRLAVIAKTTSTSCGSPRSRTSCRSSRSPPARCSAGRSATRRPTRPSPARRRLPDVEGHVPGTVPGTWLFRRRDDVSTCPFEGSTCTCRRQ